MADLVLILVLAGFTFWGMKKGFIKTLLGFASTIISFLITQLIYAPVASLLYKTPIGDLAKSIVGKTITENVSYGEYIAKSPVADAGAKVLVSVIAFILVLLIVKVAVAILVKTLALAAKIPGIKQADKLLGGVIGFISGLFIAYIAVGVFTALGENGSCVGIGQSIKDSFLASLLMEGNVIYDTVSSVFKK